MKNLFLLIICFLLFTKVYAQGVFTSAATGNWNATGTWALSSGSDADGIPDSDDDVTILDDHTVTVNVASACNNLSINSDANANMVNATVTISSSQSLTLFGNLTNDKNLTGSGTLIIGGSTPQTLTGSANIGSNNTILKVSNDCTFSRTSTFNNITVDASKTLTLSATVNFRTTITLNGALAGTGTLATTGNTAQTLGGITTTANLSVNNVSGGSTSITSNCTFGNVTVQSVVSLTVNTGAILTVTGNYSNASCTPAASCTTAGGTTNIAAGATINVGGTFTNNTGTISLLGSTMNISGTLGVTGNTTNDPYSLINVVNGGIATFGGTLTNNGIVSNAGTLNVTGTTTNNLTINGNGAYNFTGTVTNAATGTINTGGAVILSTNLTNNGIVTNAGTLSVAGTTTNNGTTTINGTLSSTGNLTNNGASSVMSIAAAGIVNASGTFTNDGSLTNDGTLNATGAVTLSAGSTTSGSGVYNLLSNLTNNATTATLTTVNLNNSASGTQTLSGASGTVANITNLNYPAGSNGIIRINGGTTASPTTPTFNITNAIFSGSGSVTMTQQGTPTINITNLTHALSGTSDLTINAGTYGAFTSFAISNTGINSIVNNANLTVSTLTSNNAVAVTLTNNATLSVTTATLNNSGIMTFNGTGGTLNLGTLSSNATGSTRLNGTGTYNITNATFNGNSTVLLANANAPTINFTNLAVNLNSNILTFKAAGTYGPISSLTVDNSSGTKTITNEDVLTITTATLSNATTLLFDGTGSVTITTLNSTATGATQFDGTATFNITNATFSGTSTVSLAPTGTPAVNFTNLAVNLNGSTFTFNVGGTYNPITLLTVDNSTGNKTITNNGTISVTTATLSNSTTLTFNGTAGILNLGTLTSTATGSTRFNGTGTTNITDATFSGTSSVIFANANSPAINITNLTNNLNGNDITFNAIGTYGPLTSLTMNTGVNSDRTVLNKDITVTNLTLTKGRIEPAATFSLIVTGSISGGGTASYINTGAAGAALRRNGISGVSLFPVGNSRYNPVSITPSASTDIAVRAVTAVTHTPSVPDETRTALVQYDIRNLGVSGVTADITLTWQAGDQGANYVASTPKNMYQVLAGNWTLVAGSTAGSTSASTPGLSLASGSTNTLAAFAQTALPVELINFTATIENDNALLTWRTLSERNNRGFDIEKSLNSKDFYKIGFKDGAGSTDQAHDYSFVDYELSGVSYYRLKQTDLDGRFEYSKVAVVIPEGMSDDMKVSPNPATDKLKISIKGTIQQVNILNLNGQLVFSKSKSTKNIDITDLPEGMYLLQVITENGVKTKKFVKH